MAKMILMGGTGRSGTSIVKEVIAHHREAATLPFEYRFIIDPDGLADFYASYTATWSPFIADRKLKRLESFLTLLSDEPTRHRLLGRLIRRLNPGKKRFSPRTYHGWELSRHMPNYDRHVRELMNSLVSFTFPAAWVGTESYRRNPRVRHAPPYSKEELAPILGRFVDGLIGDLLEVKGKGFFVEDNTWNVLFAGELLDIIPDISLIHVYRDPRDVVASFKKQRWSPTDVRQGALWYRDMMERWFDVRASLPAGACHEVSLERFVASPEEEIERLCEFAELSFDEAMLRVDLSHANTGRWRHELDEKEKHDVHEILGDILTKLGYSAKEQNGGGR